MTAENFFSRWSRRKAEAVQGKPVPAAPPARADGAAVPGMPAPVKKQAPPAPAAEESKPALTLEDVAQLKPDSDFTPFVARGVDESVRRAAMKKLFSDPHFNVMDGLDVYIDDYNKFEPLPAAMLASLEHAKGVLNPVSLFEKPQMQTLDQSAEEQADAGADDAQAAAEPESAEPAQGNDDGDGDAAAADSPTTISEKSADDDPIQSM